MFWKNINSYLGREKANYLPKSMSHNKESDSGDYQIAQHLNKYFSKVAPNLLKKMPKHQNPNMYLRKIQENINSFFFKPTKRYEILTQLNNLNLNKAKDVYDFPVYIIKGVTDLIAEPLSLIINSRIYTETN